MSTQKERQIELSEIEKHADFDSAWTVVYGKVYDITDFIKQHPGGSIIKLAAGRDATCLYEHSHPGYSMKKVAAALENKGKYLGVLKGYTGEPDSKFFVAVRDNVENYLKEKGWNRRQFEAWNVTESILTAAIYFLATYLVAITGSYWSACLLGLITGRLGFLMHTGNHAGSSRSTAFNRFVGHFMDLAGSSNLIWQYEHQVAHHISPNEYGKDNDCEIGTPYFRFHPAIPYHWYQKFQFILVPIGISIGFLKWYISDFFNLAARQVGHIKITAVRPKDYVIVAFFKTLWFVLHIAIPVYYYGLGRGVCLGLLPMVVGAHYLENIFIVNHIQEGLIPDISKHWAEKQILATSNWASGSHLANFIAGGLNHQVEHHLFPSMSTYLYPYISPIVRKTCAEYGVPYRNYESLPSAWWAMITNLYDLGHPKDKKL